MRVAVLGVGIMGSAMAERLASQGFEVALWNRTREKAESLAKSIGATVYPSPWSASERSDFAIAFLADDNALLAVAADMRRADGLVYINSSTVTPRVSQLVASHLEGLGICYVEAPVVGGANDVRQGRALFLAAGDKSCVRSSGRVLSAAGEVMEVGETIGSAMALKLAYNAVLISTVGVLGEAVTLAELYGVSPSTLQEVMKRTAFSEVANKYLPRMLDPSSPVHFRLSLAAKDLEYASRAAFDASVPLHIVSTASRLFKQAEVHGLGARDYTKVLDFMRPRRAS
ncbi:MAG: 3-hydroxyisobutyrate dehydrogenase [uncultured Acidilobus sp. OSP8]|nr:MAG: 3-hydroxyisobutyrate dehydrogenase [uncultured Acidilobus sp. OSP8]